MSAVISYWAGILSMRSLIDAFGHSILNVGLGLIPLKNSACLKGWPLIQFGGGISR
jgi:hypothetical protein